VGETTGGGAHPVNSVDFGELQVQMSLPFGRAINPITRTNWEGTGITPHEAVPAEEALDRALLLALEAIVTDKGEAEAPAAAWALAGLKATADPMTLTTAEMESYTGQFGQRRIWIEAGSLYYARGENSPMLMTPMGDDLFMFEELDWFRLSCEVVDGESRAVVGHYNTGRTDRSERSGD